MIQERHDARDACIAAAQAAAIVELPAATRREIADRAASIGGRIEVARPGRRAAPLVPLPPEDDGTRAGGAPRSASASEPRP